MSITKGLIKSMLAIGTVLLLSTPLMAGHGPGDGTGNSGHGPGDGTGNSGYGPGDGTGTSGDSPADGTGNGPGDCSAS